MKIKYIDYKDVCIKEVECEQIIFSLDKDNAICLNNDDTLKSALKIPKSNIQFISD